jgi:hypothetical protein
MPPTRAAGRRRLASEEPIPQDCIEQLVVLPASIVPTRGRTAFGSPARRTTTARDPGRDLRSEMDDGARRHRSPTSSRNAHRSFIVACEIAHAWSQRARRPRSTAEDLARVVVHQCDSRTGIRVVAVEERPEADAPFLLREHSRSLYPSRVPWNVDVVGAEPASRCRCGAPAPAPPAQRRRLERRDVGAPVPQRLRREPIERLQRARCCAPGDPRRGAPRAAAVDAAPHGRRDARAQRSREAAAARPGARRGPRRRTVAARRRPLGRSSNHAPRAERLLDDAPIYQSMRAAVAVGTGKTRPRRRARSSR